MRESKRRVLVIRTDCQILLRIFKLASAIFYIYVWGSAFSQSDLQ